MSSVHESLDALPKPSSYRKVKTPTVIQMEATECGAAALCIVLGYYKRFITLEEARIVCSVSRNGSNAFNILRAAEQYGLEASGYHFELPDLYEARLPLIAFWNFEHFVVIEGFGRNKVYLNDPAHGPRSITYEELDESFTGVALLFEPGPAFKPSEAIRISFWRDLWQRFQPFHSSILYVIFLGLLATIPLLALPVLSRVFVDHVLIERIYSWKWGLLVGALLASLLGAGISLLQTKVLNRLSIQLSIVLSGEFFWHLLRLPISFYVQRYGGEIASRIGLNEIVAETFSNHVLTTFINLVFAFLLTLIMFYYDIPITLVGISVVLINIILMTRLYRSREDAYANYQQNQGQLTGFAIGGLDSMESVKAMGGENRFFTRYSTLYTRSLNTLQQILRADLILGTFSPFLFTLGNMIILMMGAWRILEGRLTLGEFFALQMLFNSFIGPVSSLVNLNQVLQLLKINFNRLQDVLRNKEDRAFDIRTPALRQLSELDKLRGYVELRNITFGFSRLDPPILQDIHLTLTPGESVALVGPSGCGKSTLIKIIGGLLPPWSGEIVFDGIPREQYPSEVITRSISIVEQVPSLFNDSIQNNISLMDPAIDQQSLIRAAQDALIHDEIMARPGGYQSIVEKQGSNFSGGQRQRLEIACALFRNPSILILDEATSAIDSVAEVHILENIRRRGCACLMIAHRLSTIRYCDQILVMDQGKIVQRGTHEDLIKQEGLYRTLVYSEDLARMEMEH